MRKKISAHDVTYGMWVSELDRPWLGTPFLFQGFEVSTSDEIETLRSVCEYVYIDTELSNDGSSPAINHSSIEIPTEQQVPGREDQTPVEEELGPAKEIYENSTVALAEIMDGVQLAKKIDSQKVNQIVTDVATSVVRNPDALNLLTRLKTKDSYTYSHSLDVCALALIFGRHLGLSKEELDILGTGTLLLDIGKMRLPKELLEKPGKLTPAEYKVIKTHVAHSVDIMSSTKGILPAAIEIAHTHHERNNGSGYPRKLADKEIPVFGKVAAIIDCYDAMTSERVYRPAISSHKALRKLYARKDEEFQAVLVEQFIQCLGVYPVGSLVELSTSEVGVVLSQNRVRRLRPKIMVILDKNKKPNKSAPIIDLMKELADSSGNPLDIKEVVEPSAYGIDPKEFFL
jgi:HD-GYP domain-containing protein (c-di-GMP phosphodiesterase class II)